MGACMGGGGTPEIWEGDSLPGLGFLALYGLLVPGRPLVGASSGRSTSPCIPPPSDEAALSHPVVLLASPCPCRLDIIVERMV